MTSRKSAMTLVPCLLVLLCTSACSTPVGLIRTPFAEKESVTLPSLGISIDIPKQPQNVYAQYIQDISDSQIYQKNTKCKAALILRMHPSWSGQPLTEPEYLLEFTIRRLSAENHEKFRSGEHTANQDKFFGREPTAFQSEISERVVKESGEWREYLCFRKDIRLPNGDVTIAAASLLHNAGVNPKEDEDVAAIKAILNSIKPIPLPALK